MYRVKFIYIGKWKTPFAKWIPEKISIDEWGVTGGRWEEQISYQMNLTRFKLSKLSHRIGEIIVLLLIYKTLIR